MNKIAYLLILAASLALPATAIAQSTQKLSASKANEYGLIYNLPQTVFDVTLEAEGVVEKPGEFYQYARIYLNQQPIMKTTHSWRLKSAIIKPVGVADKNEEYLVQFKPGVGVSIFLNEENVPLSVNDPDFPLPLLAELPQTIEAGATVLDSPAAAYAISGEMAAGTSVAKRAELAAAKIFEIRDTRNEIISGQSENQPADGRAMKLMLDNLAQQEEVLTAMFLGTRQTSTQVQTFRFVPGVGDERMVIARISALKGIVAPTDLSGDPVYLDLKVTDRGELPLTEKGEPKRFPKGGLAYRIPGKASLTVVYDNRDYATLTTPVAQYGVVFGLDPSIFSDKKSPYYLFFDPVTGGIRELGTRTTTPAE